MAKDAKPANRVARGLQTEQKKLARLNGAKVHSATRLPKVDLVYFWLRSKKVEPIMVGICNP